MALTISPDIASIITGAAQRYGVDPQLMLAVAQIESGGNPRAQNPNSSAGGLFQFIDSTAKGYGLADRFDPAQSADAAARLTRDNAAHLARVLGREPTAAELYLAHQQGAGGAASLLADPSVPAASVVGADAVRLNGGSDGMTAGDFAGLWGRKIADVLGVALPATGQATGQAPAGGSGRVSDEAFRAAVAGAAPKPATKQEKIGAAGRALYDLGSPDMGLSQFKRRPMIAIGRG